nr:MAG TPA: hypothetical protein [Caudoviricetes sp.]
MKIKKRYKNILPFSQYIKYNKYMIIFSTTSDNIVSEGRIIRKDRN